MKHSPYTRPKKPLKSDMNVVPYIDVMLVLLIIFMATTPMLTTGVQIELPKEHTQTLSQDKQLPVIISLKADGSLLLSHDSTVDEPMTEEALMDKLSQINAQQNNQLYVMLNADASNSYRTIMHLMARLQAIGIDKIGLLSHPPQDRS